MFQEQRPSALIASGGRQLRLSRGMLSAEKKSPADMAGDFA
jgi:hypothetical protein